MFSHHKTLPLHHPVKIKQDYTASPLDVKDVLSNPHSVSCSSQYTRFMTIINSKGSLSYCSVVFCKCVDEFTALIQMDLWPATPKRPTSAMSISLLNTFVSLQLEDKISLLSFCDSLAWRNGFFDNEVKLCLNRFVNLKTVCPLFNGFGDCAACPKENGSVFYCFDANFGLVLKKSSSSSVKTTTRSNMFIDDETVDAFIETYDETSKDKDCSNFQTGSHIRSKIKNKKLSVTGVFGMSCRHEFPRMFLNMRYGERLGYPVMLLDKLHESHFDKNIHVHVIYNIACVLKRHLEKRNTLLYTDFQFAIPAFHSYGHKGDCQIKNSIRRRLDSFGLMDGELMERLWSYLRSFSKITKEMTSAHRTDLLCDALYHFGAIKMAKLGESLVQLKNKACKVLENCSLELKSISLGLPIPVSDDTFRSWKNEEDLSVAVRKNSTEEQNGSLIANRLCGQINKMCKEIKSLVTSFNDNERELHPDHENITDREAFELSSLLYSDITRVKLTAYPGVPCDVKRMAVQYYLRRLRAEEELVLIEEESVNCVEYWKKQENILCEELRHTQGPVRVLLQSTLEKVQEYRVRLDCLFQSAIDDELEFGEDAACSSSDDEVSIDDEEVKILFILFSFIYLHNFVL